MRSEVYRECADCVTSRPRASGPDGYECGTAYFAAGRWTKNGQPDPKFGTNGSTHNTIGGDSAAAFAGTASGDTITLAGIDIAQGDFAVARYTNKG